MSRMMLRKTTSSLLFINNNNLNSVIKTQYAHRSVATEAAKYYTIITYLFLRKNFKLIKKAIQNYSKPATTTTTTTTTKKIEAPKDVVVLYQFPRTSKSPSLSPFPIKLETFLRITDIKYINDLSGKLGSRGLIPWIKLNDHVVEDSQLCIEYLSKVYNKDLDSHLTDEQKAISRAVQRMVDESLRLCMFYHRFWLSNNKNETNLPWSFYWYMRYRIYKVAYGQGYGRFTSDEFYDIGKRDLKALNTLIGSKNYLFGNDKPSTIDCSIFGMCVQFIYQDLGPLHLYITTECPNLIRYVNNMRSVYWKDWQTNALVKKSNNKNNKSSSTSSTGSGIGSKITKTISSLFKRKQ